MPPGPRKSGIPLAVEMPAPVSMRMQREDRSKASRDVARLYGPKTARGHQPPRAPLCINLTREAATLGLASPSKNSRELLDGVEWIEEIP